MINNYGILQVLQGQVSNHQIAVEKLKKAAEVLLDSRGELASDKEEIQKTLGKMLVFLNAYFYHLRLHANARREKMLYPHLCHCSSPCFVELQAVVTP